MGIRLCRAGDIPEQGTQGFAIGEQNLFAVKRDGLIYVYENSCPHLGVELNWLEDQFLDLDGELIQCATHGALFTIETGECLAGPCRGSHLRSVPFNTVDGWIEIAG